jgi:AraC-like DNA-binding protein
MIHHILSAYYFNPFKPSKMPLHDAVGAYTLRWLIRGDAELMIDSKKIHLCSGQIIVCPPHSAVTMSFDEKSDVIYSITAFEGDLTLLKSLPLEQPITISAIERELLFQFFYTASQYCNESAAICAPVPIKQYTVSLLEAFLSRVDILHGENKKIIFWEPLKVATQVNDQKISFEIKQYLAQRLSTSISLSTLADELGVSINTAMHAFRKDVGMGIMAYFSKLKIEKAMHLIREGNLSFRTISEQLGFESPEYFSRVFKKQTGMTPTEYAKQQNKWSGCLASLFM